MTVIPGANVGYTAMLIVAALMLGMIVFTGNAIFIRYGAAPPLNSPMMIYFPLGLSLMFVAFRFVAPTIVTNSGLKAIAGLPPEEKRRKYGEIYLNKTIMGVAALEAAGFFNAAAHMVNGSFINVGAVAIVLTIMAVTFPSQTQFESWVDQIQRDTL